MMKKALLACLLFFITGPALGQSWDGPGQQTIAFTPAHTLGDGSTAQGGIAPALENGSAPIEPADIADNFTRSDWVSSTDTGSRTVGGPEGKARFHCHWSHESKADPILAFGNPNGPHLHSFFGNTGVNENSTYTTLRTTGWSTCGGGIINRTGYWYPSIRKRLESGVHVTIKPERISVYYFVATADAAQSTRLPRGLKYISGYNPSDPKLTPMLNALQASNAAIGSSSRFTWFNTTSAPTSSNVYDGFEGWRCDNETNPAAYTKKVPYLKNAAGQDMFVVMHGAACGAGRMSFVLLAPRCWDGKNLTSPDGRSHVSHMSHDNTTGTKHCPDGWYKLPAFEGTFVVTTTGPEDYLEWYFSSDRMNPSTALPDASSRSPCRQVGPWFCNGETGHFDWLGAWSYGTEASPRDMLVWMRRCAGVKTYPSATGEPADCKDNSVDSGAGNALLGDQEVVPATCIADITCPKKGPSNNWQLWVVGKPAYSTIVPQSERYATPVTDVNDALEVHGSHGPN